MFPGEWMWNVAPAYIFLIVNTPCGLVDGVNLELDHGRLVSFNDCAGLSGWSGTVVPMTYCRELDGTRAVMLGIK